MTRRSRSARPSKVPALRAVGGGAASGLLLLLAFPPPDQRWVAFFALVPLLLALRGASGRTGALAGAAFGLVFFGVLLQWLVPFGWLAWAALVVPETALAAAFGWLAAWSGALGAWGRLAGWPLLWAGLEILRSRIPLGGFEWGGLGYTQHSGKPLVGLARIGGVYLVALALALIAALLAEALAARGRRGALLLAAAAGITGLSALAPVGIAGERRGTLDVAVIQGNVAEGTFTGARAPRTGPEDFTIAENHARLSVTLADDPPDLVVWPENSLDRDPFETAIARPLHEAVARVRAPFLVGAILNAGPRKFYNANILFDAQGNAVGRYEKMHLVPFGEYVPWPKLRDWISALDQVPFDAVPGDDAVVFEVAGARVGSVICFESSFPHHVSWFVRRGAEVLVVSTNNASFGRSALAPQHLAISRMRAVEHGRAVVHAAISGISAVVMPDGRVVRRTDLFEPAIVRERVPLASGLTPFTRYGGYFISLMIAGACSFAALGAWSRFRRRGAPVKPAAQPGGPPPRPAAGDEPWLILPTYNEAQTIREVVGRALAADARLRVLVVDDDSPDGTGHIADEIAAGEPRVRVLHRPEKGGLGRAYLAGFAEALAGGAWAALEMDSDLSHDPTDLPRFIEAARHADVVVGSRAVPGGRTRNWSPLRKLLSRAGNAYARAMLRLPLTDSTSGYRCYRREVLEEIGLDEVVSEGYAFQIEMAWRAHTAGFDLIEIPIVFTERGAGQSKMSRRIVWEAVRSVARWAVSPRRKPPEPHPRSVSAPASPVRP